MANIPTSRPVDSTYRNERGQPVDGPITPTPNTRIDTTLDHNQPLEPQSGSRDGSSSLAGAESSTDDAMARSESWADGTATRTSTGNTRADQARNAKPDDVD